jgi:hypothetical protein
MLRKKGRRLVKVHGHEIRDADISHVSLVKRGANGIPFAIVKSEAWLAEMAKLPVGTVIIQKGDATVVRSSVLKGDEIVPCAELRKGLTLVSRLHVDGTVEDVNMPIRKADYQAPATRDEVAADTDAKARRRAEVELRRRLEVERDAKVEVANKLVAEDRYSPANDAAIKVLERDIAILDAQLARLPGDVAKSELDPFDLLMFGVATNFVRRGGTSQTVDASALPATLSKADQQLADDLRADLLGIRRQPAAPIKKGDDDDEPLSNSIGLRRRGHNRIK